jgi:2-amino-4-hydroxy-6-hydroxymethyldihydropteridine diphosphokinase
MEIGLSLGSNLGDRLANLAEATRRILALPGVRRLAASPVYETDPVGVQPQYRHLAYLNAVLIVASDTPVETLAESLRGIEHDLGRRRGADRNAPRPIDIDILYAGQEQRATAALEIPHPRWAQRRFVVQPLADVRPGLVLPGSDRTIAQILAGLTDPGRVTRVADAIPDAAE